MSLKTLLSIAAFIAIPALAKAEYYQFELKFNYSPNTEARKTYKGDQPPPDALPQIYDIPDNKDNPEHAEHPIRTREQALAYAQNRLQTGWNHEVQGSVCQPGQKKGDDVTACEKRSYRNNKVVGVIIHEGKKRAHTKNKIDWTVPCHIGDVRALKKAKSEDLDDPKQKAKPQLSQGDRECDWSSNSHPPTGGTNAGQHK